MHSELKNTFNEIYTAYYRKSYLYVRSYIHDDMASEDIVSEALIKLWERMKRETIDPVRPYLFTILKNSALDYLKHQTVKKEVYNSMAAALNRELEIRTNALESSNPNVIFSFEIEQIIGATLNSLPERTREIFILSRFGDKSHKEIATLMNISVKGVDYHILQAVKELRSNLKDYLPLFFALTLLK